MDERLLDDNRRDQLGCPSELALDQQGNLYVTDCNRHRVQRFDLR